MADLDELSFAGAAGRTITARLTRPHATPRGWAIFAHCFACDPLSIAAEGVAAALARNGVGVLRLDFTAAEGSDAAFAGDPSDLEAAAAAMAARGHEVGLLVGHSLGAMAAIAAAPAIPSVRALATLAAPADLTPFLDRARPDEDDPDLTDLPADERVMQVRPGLLEALRGVDAVARVRDLDAALLILHAPGDRVVDIAHATRLFVAARHPKSFVSLDDADHLLSRTTDVDFAAAVIAAWAARYLPQPKPDAAPIDIAPGATAVETGRGRFQNHILAGGASFLADEPIKVGGLGTGPSPFDLICAGLAACTSMTLRMYARHKGLPLSGVRATVTHNRSAGLVPVDRLTTNIQLDGELSAQQRAGLLAIAARCPVHLMLVRGADIDDHIVEHTGP
ncbi:MAG: OsmC family protein [Caulobacterales bacterium]|nr:OsmC family protein [Caulobacterales bacterium]